MEFINHLDLLLRARFTLICIKTYEEERIIDNILTLCEKSQRQCCLWDHADFFQALTKTPAKLPRARDPFTVLEQIEKLDGEIVFIRPDGRRMPVCDDDLQGLADAMPRDGVAEIPGDGIAASPADGVPAETCPEPDASANVLRFPGSSLTPDLDTRPPDYEHIIWCLVNFVPRE